MDAAYVSESGIVRRSDVIDLEVEYRKQKRREFFTAFFGVVAAVLIALWIASVVYPRIGEPY